MRFELRKSGGKQCPHCGSFDLLYTPVSNATLEADLVTLFRQDAPRWRPFKRAAYRRVQREIERVSADLRARSLQEFS